MKKILGLDLGTNSIGWALIEQNHENGGGKILGMGSRIIPMTQDMLDNFEGGKPIETQTASRTAYRGVRRLNERHHLRRERLHRVLNIMGLLPKHYADQVDFEKHFGKFIGNSEPKLPWKKTPDGKYEFIFMKSFEEMLDDFSKSQLDKYDKLTKIPSDWTIYYLRKKALTRKVEKEELAWILLNFNQKRGYYQLRGEEEEENPNKLVEFHSLRVVDVVADEKPNTKGDLWYSLHLENGWVYRRSSKMPLFDWKDKVRDFIVTTDLDDSGNVKKDKEGYEKRSFRAPSEDDWTLLKKKTEADIEKSGKTIGEYIYDHILQNPSQKIRGKLVRTVERKYYREELRRILTKQHEFHPELQNEELYSDCLRELYRNNEAHRLVLSKRDFVHLFMDDIIFYQRPLRSQKSAITNCSLEYVSYVKDGCSVKEYLKAIPKSNPYYQEFRVWQWLYNLSIYRRDGDVNVTSDYLNSVEAYEKLFDFLNDRKEIDQKQLIKYLLEYSGLKGKALTAEVEKYRWNYVEDKKYPCNETGCEIRRRFEKVSDLPDGFHMPAVEYELWHIIYSVTDKNEFEKALKSFAKRHGLDKISFVDAFRKFPPFKSDYGTYSEKAIKKLLRLMRLGKYWSWEAIDDKTKDRIDKLLTGEYDETIPEQVRKKVEHLSHESDFQGMQLWMAQYVVYGRHSEASDMGKLNSVEELNKYLKDFKQHSLRNPIVEQVITETLKVVGDIWQHYGGGTKDFFDEIHIELGRDMKNTAEQRQRITNKVLENENTNQRIKALLMELKETDPNVRPYSPMQQDILKLYEEYALGNDEKYDDVQGRFVHAPITDDILKISRAAQPSKAELQRYKLYLEQRCRSPYTGQMIPLSKLFTKEYEIEHIIPKSRYLDDGMNNKVICEAAVNQLKDNLLGFEFIKECHGQKVETGFGRTVTIFSEEEYKQFVQDHYAKNATKRKNLLLDEIPDKMIERQMNDTRYISKFITVELSKIVRGDKNDDGVNSKNMVSCNGRITTILKQDWGLNDVWNDLVIPRFERMNQITESSEYTAWNAQYQKFLPAVPIDHSKGFQKKRIDHRHHAMDALVIACVTRDHVNLLNNKYAKSDRERYDLKHKLMRFERSTYLDAKSGRKIERDIPKDFLKPWDSFTADAKYVLAKTVVSFKQNLRVINKATNRYEKWVEKDGEKIKTLVQQQGVNWAIRKPLHKETVAGVVNLRFKKTVNLSAAISQYEMIADKALKAKIKQLQGEGLDKKKIQKFFADNDFKWQGRDVAKPEVYYFSNEKEELVASRVSLDSSFNSAKIMAITDTGIQKILLKHLKKYDELSSGKVIEHPEQAFAPEGIEEMNKNIVELNDGKFHQPILKVRTYEPKGNKFNVGLKGNKSDKFVEAAKGTNLFFAIYADEEGKRNYQTIQLIEVIERLKQGLQPVPDMNEKGHTLLFHLSPNDLVYVPDENGTENTDLIDWSRREPEQTNRIYKVVNFSKSRLYVIPVNVAVSIVNKMEFTAMNKIELTKEKERIVKLRIDRLGNIGL